MPKGVSKLPTVSVKGSLILDGRIDFRDDFSCTHKTALAQSCAVEIAHIKMWDKMRRSQSSDCV